jgi:hypothetical protein
MLAHIPVSGELANFFKGPAAAAAGESTGSTTSLIKALDPGLNALAFRWAGKK